ncbi:MAG: anti-sigma factor ChrR (cupin superfamily) [Halieaceae bacterium]|jgi:anti-sigma factor ChrR (cupin superfamily)
MDIAVNPYVSEQGDILANIHTLPWLEVGGGTRFKVLRACRTTGDWALFVNMEPGASFQPHRHQGPGQFFITKGELLYEVGSAPEGTYGFEPVFAEHSEARCEIETEMLFLGCGAVTYFKEDRSIDYIFDAESLLSLIEGEVELDIGN